MLQELPPSLSSMGRSRLTGSGAPQNKKPSPKKFSRGKKIALGIVTVLLIVGGLAFWKADSVIKKISPNGGLFSSLVHSLPGVSSTLQGESDGRINILLLAMRGEGVEGGGTLADTIEVLSLHIAKDSNDTSRASLVSIPRDLYVSVPGKDEKRKINAVYALGNERDAKRGGMDDMRKVVGDVTGLPIQYAVVINYQGFTDLVNALGGINVHLDAAFDENVQFQQAQVCDPYVFTVPTNPVQYETKYGTRPSGRKYISKQYPLCYNKDEECGGNFALPAGDNHLDGIGALCFARARYTTTDFDRARRQQEVIQSVRQKATSLGTLTDISTVNKMLGALGNNLKTDLEPWEMERFFELYKNKFSAVTPKTAVIDDSSSPTGFLYAPAMTPETGYILLPKGDTYDQIKAYFQKIP
ncbi:MAG: LCP family protein [Candidatus Moraniibacteriota bacterium]